MTVPLTPTPPTITQNPGPAGGPTWSYRGALIDGNELDTQFRLRLPGHPYDGHAGFRQRENVVRLIDAWLDRQTLPPPYVWPGKKGA